MLTNGRLISLLLSALLVLNGCSAMQKMKESIAGGGCSDAQLSQPEKQLCDDNSQFNSTVAGGAMIGAVAGGLLTSVACLAAGGRGGQCAAYAAAGAVAGGIVGGIDGYLTAKKQEAAKQNIRDIDAVTIDVRNDNARLQQSLQTAQAVVKERSDRLQWAGQELKAGRITLDQARGELSRTETAKQNLDQLIQGLEKREDKYKQAVQKTQERSADFDTQIQTMDNDITRLKQQRDALSHALEITGIS